MRPITTHTQIRKTKQTRFAKFKVTLTERTLLMNETTTTRKKMHLTFFLGAEQKSGNKSDDVTVR